jgi:hypothetical protein
MPQHAIVYLGGEQPSRPEEGKLHRSKYMDWLSSLGDSGLVQPIHSKIRVW